MEKKHLIPLAALSIFGMTNMDAARNGKDGCAPTPGAACYPDNSKNCYCLGPENYGVNAPVYPLTCNGDFTITVAGFYWNAHQDGMEYAIDSKVSGSTELNNLTAAEYQTPNFDWDFGFKVGLGYATTTDGWDIGVQWTWYQGKANDHIERESDDNATLLPLWSAYAPAAGGVLFATDIETHWKLKLNLVDIELGRNFWSSKYLALRPFVGLRVAFLEQNYQIQHKGGSWTASGPFNNQVTLDNNFKGVGLRGGLNSTWNFGSGFGLYANSALSIVYGRFSEGYDETNRLATTPSTKTKIAEYNYSFRASRAMLDLALGVQWATMFSDCQYGFSVALGWEHHLFLNQNQMWRITRIGDTATTLPNNTGENVYSQRSGDLDTQGWTLTVNFAF